jgi:hypothetical protein
MNLTKKIIIALILGVAVGIGFNLWAPNAFVPFDTYFLTPLGQIFLKLITMLVVPLVLFSIVLGTAGMGDPKKLGRIGGLNEARAIHDLCAEHGVPVWCGGMLETGIGRAANLALAALPNFMLPGDTSASDRYYARDLTPPFELTEGRLRVPTGPGIGVGVLPEVLEELTTHSELVTV